MDGFFATLAAMFLVFIITASAIDGMTVTHDEVIERGYGLYCPATGDFAFIGECDVSE